MKARSILSGSFLALVPFALVVSGAQVLDSPVILRLEDPPGEETHRVEWSTEPGSTYELLESPDLMGWGTVPGFPREAVGTTDWHEFAIAAERGFFRVRIVPGTPEPPEGMVLVEGSGPFLIYMGQYVVTWAKWQSVRAWGVANGYGWSGPDHNGLEPSGCASDHPVQSVSWYDAVKWCNARSEMEGLTPAYHIEGAVYRTGDFGSHGSSVVGWNTSANGYRLPTEYEWVFAAMGGLEPQYDLFSGSNNLDEVGWYWDNSGNADCSMWYDTGHGTHPVGKKLPNSLGLFDMSGNVNEWCWDPDQNARVFKGGSWFTSQQSCMIGFTGVWGPDTRIFNCGFRVVRGALP